MKVLMTCTLINKLHLKSLLKVKELYYNVDIIWSIRQSCCPPLPNRMLLSQ